MAYKYLINTEDDFQTLLEHLESEPEWAYDTETNGKFSRFEVQLVGMSFGFDLFACYVPLAHIEGQQLDINYVLPELKPLFQSEKTIIAHHAKFDEMVLRVHGVDVTSSGDDTFIMSWLLAEDKSSKGLKPLTHQYCKVLMQTYEDVIGRQRFKKNRDYNFAKVPLEDALSYAADDAYFTYQLYKLFKERLENERLTTPYERIERPFSRVLANIERRGVNIDEEYLKYADIRLPKIAEEVEALIYEEAGEVFNIGSPKQLGDVLFKKLQIGSNVPRTKNGNYATDKKTLKTYATKHDIVDNVLRRKKIQKTYSTFVESLKEFVDKDGKVHPSFNGCGTVTGRLSCKSPNLQQIEADEVEEVKVRNFFVPSPGYVFIVGDYSQIELRVMAHLAKDENMIDAFLTGRDFHEETARKVFNIPDDKQVTHRQRFGAKAVNFGTGYGRGPASIAEQVGCEIKCKYWPTFDRKTGSWIASVGERCHDCAKCFIEDWFDTFPEVRTLKDRTIEMAVKQGFIRTLSGRKRRLEPEIRSKDSHISSGAKRQAFNTRIQGSAADIIKAAMIALQPELAKLGGHIVIQIHDELVSEVPEENAEKALETIKYIMENPIDGRNPLRLPLVTDPKIVMKWGDAKD